MRCREWLQKVFCFFSDPSKKVCALSRLSPLPCFLLSCDFGCFVRGRNTFISKASLLFTLKLLLNPMYLGFCMLDKCFLVLQVSQFVYRLSMANVQTNTYSQICWRVRGANRAQSFALECVSHWIQSSSHLCSGRSDAAQTVNQVTGIAPAERTKWFAWLELCYFQSLSRHWSMVTGRETAVRTE
jgi:hypothetical protein